MPWSLDIQHLDVTGSGDATLIIARETDGGGAVINFRSCLIDGGLAINVPNWVDELQARLQGHQLDVMVCTHYDRDHVQGLSALLTDAVHRLCDNVRIYDQGWPGDGDAGDAAYLNYVVGISGCRTNAGGAIIQVLNPPPNRTRVTIDVCSDIDEATDNYVAPQINASFRIGFELPALDAGEVAHPDPPPPGCPDPDFWNYREDLAVTQMNRRTSIEKIAEPPDTLLYTEILWDGLPIPPGAATAVPAGAPTMTCIAVNRYVAGAGDNNPIIGSNSPQRKKNEKSLAFLIQFNNFKYYVGGDIESAQEDWLKDYLNTLDTVAARVLAFKPSHHGSNLSTSRDFVNRIKPKAAIISCGTANQYYPPLPSMQTINVLDGYPALPTWEENPPPPQHNGIHTTPPPPPPNRPVASYLTGYQEVGVAPNPPIARGGDASRIAGNPQVAPPIRGHILLSVTDAQSTNDVAGQLAIGIGAAAEEAVLAFGIAQNVADASREYTKEAVIGSGATAEAAAIAALLGATIGAQRSMANRRAAQTALKDALTALGNVAEQSVDDTTYYANIQATITAALTPCPLIDNATATAAGTAASTAAAAVVQPGMTAALLAQQVVAAILLPGATAARAAAAAAAGAAAGAALNWQNAVATGAATAAAVTAAGGAAAAANNASVAATQASQATVAQGLFNLQFYDMLAVPAGNQVILHS